MKQALQRAVASCLFEPFSLPSMNLFSKPWMAKFLLPALTGLVICHASAESQAQSQPESQHVEHVQQNLNDSGSGAQDALNLDEVHVHASAQAELTQIMQRLHATPGGVQLLSGQNWLNGHTGNLSDALKYAPGVYTGGEDGSQQVRLSVRGSGIQNRWGGAGLQLLYNGIPLNRADGGFESQSIDPAAVQYMEIQRGANALMYGGAQLGGAINMVTPTGRSLGAEKVMLSYGSWNTLHARAESGREWDDRTDTYVALGYRQSDGFRKHSDTSSTILNTNLGIQIGDSAENRTYVLYSDGRRRLPGNLTVYEVKHHPRESREPTREWRRDIEDFLLANKTTWQGEDLQLEASLYTQRTHFRHPVSNAPFNFDFNDLYWTYGGAIRASGDYQFAELQHHFIAGANLAYTQAKRRGTQPQFFAPYARRSIHDDQRATQLEFYVENRTEITPELLGVLGLQWTHAKRRQKHAYQRNYNQLSPKIGLLYELTDTVSLYGNYNWSYEPPRWASLSDKQAMNPQKAETLELGVRGEWLATEFDLTYYHSWIKDRFIYVAIPPTPVAAVTNSDARQQGIELSASTNLNRLFNWDTQSYTLSLRQVFAWSDFRFHNDPTRGNNRMPIVPEFSYMAEIMLELDNGFYIGPNVEWVFGDRPIDNANSAKVDGYVIVNIKAGYQFDEHWRLFVDVRNVFDERYVSGLALYDLTSRDSRSFAPGEPASVYAGVQYEF